LKLTTQGTDFAKLATLDLLSTKIAPRLSGFREFLNWFTQWWWVVVQLLEIVDAGKNQLYFGQTFDLFLIHVFCP